MKFNEMSKLRKVETIICLALGVTLFLFAVSSLIRGRFASAVLICAGIIGSIGGDLLLPVMKKHKSAGNSAMGILFNVLFLLCYMIAIIGLVAGMILVFT